MEQIIKYTVGKLTNTMRKIVTIESPGKVERIQKILGSEYTVISSGILCSDRNEAFYTYLSEKYSAGKKLPPLTENEYTEIIDELKTKVFQTDKVYLAMDDDEFGDDTANNLIRELNLTSYKRITFNAITKEEILKAIGSK